MNPQTPAEQAEADFGDNVIWRLVNGTVVSFGGNEKGEIFLSVSKNGKLSEFIIAQDPDFVGGVALFEVERKEVPAPALELTVPQLREKLVQQRSWQSDIQKDAEAGPMTDKGIYECLCLDCGNVFYGFKYRKGCFPCDQRRRGLA